MKKNMNLLGLVLAALFVFQGVASAKTISGKIEAIDAAAKTLSVGTSDPAAAKVDISVTEKTTYAGAASLADLTVGQEVSVDAEDAAGALSAISVNVAEPAQEEASAELAEEGEAKEPAV